MMHPLDWSLVISTYSRPDVLALGVRLALHQTRPPSEVIVIDGGADWHVGNALVQAEVAAAGFQGRVVYEPAVTRALTAQRNQGIAHARSEILFLLDDDSLLYEDTAERVLEVYEADVNREVAGVGLVHFPDPPPAVRHLVASEPRQPGLRAALMRELTRLSWRGIAFFLPYDHDYPNPPVPPACTRLGANPTPMLDGFRMTFRRSICSALRFDELLQYYASYGEDHDFCYRALRLGAIVELPSARMHHAVAPAGRLSRSTVMTMLWCNRVALQVANGTHRLRAVRRFFTALPFHLGVSALRDVVEPDVRFPRTRGLLAAAPTCLRLLALGPRRVRERYPEIQARLFGRAIPSPKPEAAPWN